MTSLKTLTFVLPFFLLPRRGLMNIYCGIDSLNSVKCGLLKAFIKPLLGPSDRTGAWPCAKYANNYIKKYKQWRKARTKCNGVK